MLGPGLTADLVPFSTSFNWQYLETWHAPQEVLAAFFPRSCTARSYRYSDLHSNLLHPYCSHKNGRRQGIGSLVCRLNYYDRGHYWLPYLDTR